MSKNIMQHNEKDFNKDLGVVGNIRIKEPKIKKNKKKKKVSPTSNTPIGVKIFVWFMFFAMTASFVVPLVWYFVSYALES